MVIYALNLWRLIDLEIHNTNHFSIFGQNGILTTLLGNSIEEKEIPLSSTWIYITSLMNGSYFGSRIAFNVQGYKYNLLINIRK